MITNKFFISKFLKSFFFLFTVSEDRRRGGRPREDPRRHTLGADMLGYAHQGQMPMQQRAMDLEVTHNNSSHFH